jgi:hypothetical protein
MGYRLSYIKPKYQRGGLLVPGSPLYSEKSTLYINGSDFLIVTIITTITTVLPAFTINH